MTLDSVVDPSSPAWVAAPVRPRIAILGNKYWPSADGPSRVVEDIVSHLHDQFDFTLYTYRHAAARDHLPGVRVIEYGPYPGGVGGVFAFIAQSAWHAYRHAHQYDLVHVHKTDAAFCVPWLSRRLPVVITSHERPYQRAKWSGPVKGYFRYMEQLFIRSCAARTAIAQPLAKFYTDTYGVPVQYIPNGVAPQLPCDEVGARALLARHGVSGPFWLFAARRIIPTKGPQHLLRALRAIDFDGTLVIAGDERERPAFTRALRQLAEGLDVRFIGLVEAKALLMGLVKAAQLFVFPSETEGMSIMLLEAASMGTPIVASDIPENQAVFDAQSLRFFASGQVADLARQLRWTAAHPTERQVLAQHAQQQVRTKYDARSAAAQYATLYRQWLAATEAGTG